METLLENLRCGLGLLFKKRGFAAVAAVALALGILANTAIFNVVNAALMRPFSCKNAESIVAPAPANPLRCSNKASASPSDYMDYKTETKIFLNQ